MQSANSKPKWQFNVDLVGGCNLRCPSCPVGNQPEVKQPRGFMKPEMLDRIVSKAKLECDGRVDFALYNWTEPFLHPHLAEMIQVINSHGLTAGISSNFNIMKNIDAVMEANPRYLKMSVSGFNQQSYGITHRKGDIELVKQNMKRVAEAKLRARASTRLAVPFHRYLGNHEEEVQMSAYAQSLGFEFDPAWAYLMPLEKVLALADPDATDVKLTDEDREVVARLALPLDKALEVVRDVDEEHCKLRDQQMAINCEGGVMLCCTVYDPRKYTLGSYLDIPLAELQALKKDHEQCKSCMENGLHVLFTYASTKLDEIALENVARHYPEAHLQSMSERHRRRPRGIRAWPRKLRRQWGKFRAPPN
ncbi:MAG: radical SAM protein [bacterium]|nr:radical SAM protein [bacterium]